MPLQITPRTIAHPEIAFDKTLISLAISPVIVNNNIEAAMSMRCVPYRILPDDTIDVAENMAQTINIGAVFEQAKSDPALAKAVSRILDTLQDFLTETAI